MKTADRKETPTEKRKHPGLLQDETGTWWVDCYINKQRIRKKVGRKLADAKEALHKLKEAGRIAELFPEREVSKQLKSLTVGDLVERYHPELVANNRSHKCPARSGRIAAQFFGTKAIHQIKPEDIEAFKVQLLATKIERRYKDEARNKNLPTLAPASVNRHLARLKTLFSKAVANGLLGHNPMTRKQVKMLAEEAEEAPYLTPEQEESLRPHMEARWFRLIQLGCLTGFRCGELFKLRREKVNLAVGLVDLTKTKAKKPRFFHLGPRGVAILQEILESHSSEWVFPSKNPESPMGRRNFYGREFEPAREAAGLGKDYNLYSMRHAYAFRSILAGMDIQTLKEQMGHSSVTVTERYFRKYAPSHVKQMVQLYG